MASVRELPSGKYQGRYRNRDGKDRSAGTFTQKKQALKEAQRREDEQQQPGALDLDGGKTRWGDWFDSWHESRIVSFATQTNYDSTVKNHIRPYWGEVKLADIDQAGVSKWVKRLHTGGASPYTIRNAFILFQTSLNAAVEANRITRNPAKGVRLPDMPDAVERYLTRDEVESITFYMDGLNSLITWTAVQTGMRFGEIAGLHWHRVDLDRGMIQVVEKYDQKADRIDPVPKDKEKRSIPLPPELVVKLRHHRDRVSPAHTCGLQHTSGRCGGDLVFRGPRGAALKSNAWGVGPWKRALGLAGITDRVRVHDLRHTFASWLLQADVSLERIAPIMGHSETEMTRRYSHLAKDENYDRIREAISRASAPTSRPGPESVVATVRRYLDEQAIESTIDNVPQAPRRATERATNGRHTPLRLVTSDYPENAS